MKIINVIAGILILPCLLHAADMQGGNDSTQQLQDQAKAFTIKCAMKAYLFTADFKRLKASALADIGKIKENEFAIEYAKAWQVMRQCPAIVLRYKLQSAMTKKSVLTIVSRLTQEECQAAVDDIPDAVIIEQFNKSISDPALKNKSLAEQINILMSRYFYAGLTGTTLK